MGAVFPGVGRKVGERTHPVVNAGQRHPWVCLGSPGLVVGTEERVRKLELILVSTT